MPEQDGGVDHLLSDALGAVRASRYAEGYLASLSNVEATVCAVVDERRRLGVDIVKVVLAIKAHLAAHPALSSLLCDQVVRWCIARYYARAPLLAAVPV